MREVMVVYQHVPHEPPRLLARAAQEAGADVHIVPLWNGDRRVPGHEQYTRLLVMGGPQSAYGAGTPGYPTGAAEIESIRGYVAAGKPVLGVCLGAQLIAQAFGGAVYPGRERGLPREVGFYPIGLTAAGRADPCFAGFPERFRALQWHGDAFDLPAGAALLAQGEAVLNQAFRYQSAVGLLFHLEGSPHMVDGMIRADSAWLHRDGRVDEEQMRAEAKAGEAQLRELGTRFMRNWLRE